MTDLIAMSLRKWTDHESGLMFRWNGFKTVQIFRGSDTSWIEVDVITFMHDVDRAEVVEAIKRRLESYAQDTERT